MKDYKTLLASFIEVVTFLIAAFGGFLSAVAPPIGGMTFYAGGVLSFFILIALMTISALARRGTPNPAARKWWITGGLVCLVVAIPAAFIYPRLLDSLTFPHDAKPSARRIIASDKYLTTDAQTYRRNHPSESSPKDLIQNLADDDIWTSDGIPTAESELLAIYSCLVLSLASAVFCLLEANMGTSSSGSITPVER